MCDQQSLRSACAYAQSDQSLCWLLEYSMAVKLLTEYHLEFLSLKGGCTGSTDSTHVKCRIVGNHMSRLKCHVMLHYTRLLKPNVLNPVTCTYHTHMEQSGITCAWLAKMLYSLLCYVVLLSFSSYCHTPSRTF